MQNTTQDDDEGYKVEKEGLTWLNKHVLSITVKDIPSPLLPSRVIVNKRQQGVVDEFVAACKSEATPQKAKRKELQPFLGGGAH